MTKYATEIFRIIRYSLVGVITVAMDIVTYSILVNLGVNYVVANTINTPFILIFNFIAHKFFTFKTKDVAVKTEVGRYMFNVGIQYIFSLLIMLTCVEILRLSPYPSKIIEVIMLPIINYFFLKRFVFLRKVNS